MAEEIKSVKVDNWGVFFLQKLQNFFNKTDYCDLTLQFRDNSQLKVHRLVLSACTDYFNVLEQTCDVVDDALIMPNELQADVVVPIVNFMYTGTLEFELRMYGRLLRTAKEMNMTVLLKLLEAHRRTMEGATKPAGGPTSPIALRRKAPLGGAKPAQQQQPRVFTTKTVTQQPQLQQQRKLQFGKNQQSQVITRQIGVTSVTSTTAHKEPMSTDNFEQLRRGYNNNKRPNTTTLVAPAAKKPNIEDVKEFSEQQRMRKQIAAEFGEDPEYESILDDDIHDDDDDDDNAGGAGGAAGGGGGGGGSANVSGEGGSSTRQGQRQKQQKLMQAHEQATITIKQGIGDQPATIIVKDATNSKMNHERIISEVLRQYPHLVKGSKNIKLKIMPNAAGGQNTKTFKKPETSPSTNSAANETNSSTEITGVPTSTTSTPANSTNSQKRRIDSKTMHSLIAMGAENMTGPWLCLRCGINGRPISIPSYRSFRRHLVNTHKEKIDAALCEHCGWRSTNDRELHFHLEQEHKIKSTQYTFPVCPICSVEQVDSNTLNQHMQENHANEDKQQCIYCNKIFGRELQLYQHMKSYHKKQAIEDGIIDYEDEEYLVESLMQKEGNDPEAKVKILSDISLPVNEKLESPSSEAAGLSTVASSIATSIGVHCDTSTGGFDESFENGKLEETKFINADGNEMVLTEEQRKEIMAQLNQENVGGTVMVLQDDENVKATAMETADEADDDSQIYKELNQEEEILKTTETKEKPIKQDINQKLKELTGDWSDEDDEFTDMPTQTTNTHTESVSPTTSKEKTEDTVPVVEEDDIDLALKNLHTDASLDMPTEQSNEEENSKDVKQENLDVEMAEESKEDTVEQQTADTPVSHNELEENESELENNTSLEEKEEIDLNKTIETKLEEEFVDEKEGSTLLDDLLAEAQIGETETAPVEEVQLVKEELNRSAEEQLVEQEKETNKLHVAPPIIENAQAEEAEEETESTEKEIEDIKLLETPHVETKSEVTVAEENKTQQTVKSLISEWADDDEDDDEEDDKL